MLGLPAVSAVMHRTVETAAPRTSALAAARPLREADVGSVAVVTDGEAPETARLREARYITRRSHCRI